MKILVTGYSGYGVAKAIFDVFNDSHELKFFSKKENNVDLNDPNEINKFCQISLDYDIVINNARLKNYHQAILFEKVYFTWLTNKKIGGHIINIGSSVDIARDRVLQYGAEKAALKKISEQAATASVFKNSNIKVTYISFGWVSTPIVVRDLPNVKKHSSEEIANIIKFVINYPYATTNISEIRIEPIQ